MPINVAIIGAGIGGLSAGCYSQMNGFDTQIFEMHDKPGGVCTAWQRKGYTIDGCLHYLVGSAPGHDFYRFWQELGALQGQEVINMDQLYRFEDAQGRVFNMSCDIEQLENEMLRLSPSDQRYIKSLCQGLRQFTKFNMVLEKPPELSGITDNIKMMGKMLPVLGAFSRWSKLTLADVASNFRDPLLRTAWGYWHNEMSDMAFMTNLAWFNNKTAGYLIGGSLPFAKNIEKRFRDLGGKIAYQAKVTRIIVENDRAVGIRLSNGEEHRADYIISAADGRSTVFDMLDGKYSNESIHTKFNAAAKFPPILYIGLGLRRRFDEIPQMIEGLVLVLDKPV
jgi:phytoene dehydrogenase-like protein